MSDNYGSAPSVFAPDGSFAWQIDALEITGPRVRLEEWACIISTPAGALFWDRSKGVAHPFPALMNTTPSDTDLRRIEAEYVAAAREQVANVVNATVRLRRAATGKGVELAGLLDLDPTGPAPLSASAADVLKFLFPGATT